MCVALYYALALPFEAVISFNNTTYNNTSPWTVANLSIGLLYRVFKYNHFFQESKATSFRTFIPGFFYFVHFMLHLCGILFLFQIMDYNVILHRWYPYIKMKYGWYTISKWKIWYSILDNWYYIRHGLIIISKSYPLQITRVCVIFFINLLH